MSTSPHPVVRVTRQLPFPAERVFDAWLDPTLAAQWLFSTAHGTMVRAEIDARVGGRFTFVDRRDGQDVEHTGEYLELDRPRRLVFTFGVPAYSPDFTKVTVDITPRGPDACELNLTQEVHPDWQQYAHKSQYGWIRIVEGLAASLGEPYAVVNREPAQNTAPGEARLVRLLPGPIERVWYFLVDGEKRKTWFTDGTIEPRVGGRINLQFRHKNISPDETPAEKYREVHDPGVPMTGEVTQWDPPRLLGITWEEEKPEDNSEVIFELTPEGDDVRLVLTHRKLPSEATRQDVSSGWHNHTGILFARLMGSTPPPIWAAEEQLGDFYKRTVSQA